MCMVHVVRKIPQQTVKNKYYNENQMYIGMCVNRW